MKALLVLLALSGAAEAGHCHEVSPIVGRQKCSRFGDGWAHQLLSGLFGFDTGLVVDRVPVAAIDQSGTVYNAQGSATYHATTPGRRVMDAMGMRERFGFRGEHVVLVLEVAPAWAVDAPTLMTTVGGTTITSASGSVFDVDAVGGLHTRMGVFELGAEVGLGVRLVNLSATLPDGYTTCKGGGTGKGCFFSVTDASLLVDLRARADVWVDPQLTVGISAGVDLVNHGQSLVLAVGYHGSMFDGQ